MRYRGQVSSWWEEQKWERRRFLERDCYKPSGDQSNEKQKLCSTEEMKRELEAAAEEGGEWKNGENRGYLMVKDQ